MIKIHLSRLMGEQRITQAELARKTGVRVNTIGALYHEFVERIDVSHLSAICEALDCNVADILEYVPRKNMRRSGTTLQGTPKS